MARPSYKPTDEQRKQVEAFAAYGATHEDICGLLGGIDPKTLRKHFAEELARGSLKANMKVAEAVFRQATGAPAVFDASGKQLREEQKPVFAAGAFWLKCRGGWRETSRVEVTGKDGGPVKTLDLSKLTDEQIDALEALYGPIAGSGGDDEGDPGGEGPQGS